MPDTVASADGTPIAVWRSGSGPPLVLVHGAIADPTRLRTLTLYEPPLGFLGGSPETVVRLEALLAEGKRNEVLLMPTQPST